MVAVAYADLYGDDYADDADGGDAIKTLIWGVLYPSFPVPYISCEETFA